MSTKVILITGCSSGFGEITAKTLSQKGHTVYASMRDVHGRNRKKSEALRTWAQSNNQDLRTIEIDVANEGSIHQGVEQILALSGHIDVLVNNAGWGSIGFVETYSLKEAKEQFEVNVFGLFNLTKSVLPYMRKQQSGLIINISSIVGRAVFPMFSMYCASKFAVEGMSQSWKYELAPIGVDSVIVEPGIYPTTNFFQKLQSYSPEPNEKVNKAYGDLANMPQAFGEKVAQMVESGNFNDPQIVADTIAKLIETPFGQRPIRVVADPMTESLYQPYNDQAESLQGKFLEMFMG